MDKIRVGVVGVRRGEGFARGAGPHMGMELVALCDTWEERLAQAAKSFDVATYADYDSFLEHDMDAVILANYFHEHAPFAIKALDAGMHVMSETSACFTMGEGVALVEAVERSGKTYMFAENYPFMVFNQEMRRLYQLGKVGAFMYGEAEYVHSMDADGYNRLSPGLNHWRNWIPATYYCTHAMGPIMYITDTMPRMVNAQVIARTEDSVAMKMTARVNDAASAILVRMDNGAVAKLLQVGLRGDGIWVRIHGSQGLMENLRTGERKMVRLVREQYHEERVDPQEQIYLPDFPVHHEEAMKAGHGGGDFFTNYHFAEAIKQGGQPYLDVYRGVAMSCVGIQAYRSALDNGNGYEIPNFKDPVQRDKYRNDDWNPDPTRHVEGFPYPSIKGKIEPTPDGIRYAAGVWKAMGHDDDYESLLGGKV